MQFATRLAGRLINRIQGGEWAGGPRQGFSGAKEAAEKGLIFLNESEKSIAQGLKPSTIESTYGTTKVMP